VPRDLSVVLCGLETERYPPTVLGNEVAQRVPCASAAQGRVRGSLPHSDGLAPETQKPERAFQPRPREQGEASTPALACIDAERAGVQRRLARLSPSTASAASGARRFLRLEQRLPRCL